MKMCRRTSYYLIVIIVTLLSNRTYSQIRSEVKVAGISDRAIVNRMENASMALIDAINFAFTNGEIPRNPDNNLIDKSAIDKILGLWAVSKFKVTVTQLAPDGYHLSNGEYQIRNIPVFLSEEANKDEEKEIALTFDRNGKLIDCSLCLGMNVYSSLIRNGNSVTELRQRQILLDFIEKFRTAYNIRDLNFIKTVFNDNALIIVGKIIKEIPSRNPDDKSLMINTLPREQVKYTKQSKVEYIQNLSNAFKKNQYVNIEFDSIEIVQSRQYSEVYGVTLKQTWKSTGYNDKGWLFLMVDFRNEDTPQIYVRTWQPGMLNGRVFPREDVFRLSNFNIERD